VKITSFTMYFTPSPPLKKQFYPAFPPAGTLKGLNLPAEGREVEVVEVVHQITTLP
jgi:hypothetical protein